MAHWLFLPKMSWGGGGGVSVSAKFPGIRVQTWQQKQPVDPGRCSNPGSRLIYFLTFVTQKNIFHKLEVISLRTALKSLI